jgi:phage terminase Nu1 subunit (DNA packaging protein)
MSESKCEVLLGVDEKMEGRPTVTYQQVRIERERAQTALARLEFERRVERLVEREAVKREACELARALQDVLLSIPDAIADNLVELADREAIRARLAGEILRALERVADGAEL